MAIDFPNSPSTNDTYSVGNITWKYDGSNWIIYTVSSPATSYLSDATPIMDSTAGAGVGILASRYDHVHPSDTSRAALDSPTFTGTPAAPTAAADTNTTQIATTSYVVGQGYLKSATASSTYQPVDGDLTAIAAISGTGILKRTGTDTWTTITDGSTNWDSAYTDRLKWDGGSTGLTAATGRASLGATTLGENIFTISDVAAISFLKINANNTVTTEPAATFLGSIGAMSNPLTTTGDIIYSSSGTTGGRLGIGTNGQALVVSAGVPAWATLTMENMPSAAYKRACRAATTTISGNITLSGGAPSTLDGVTLAANDRILVKNQTSSAQNGIYVITTLGTGSNGTWTRATDADTSGEIAAAFAAVEEGTINGGDQFSTSFRATDTIGTTAMSWTEIIGYATIPQGSGFQTYSSSTTDLIATSPSSSTDYFNDFISALVADGTTVAAVVSGTGAAATWTATAAANRPGTVVLTTGTTATGRAAVGTNMTSYVGGAAVTTVFQCGVNIPTLSTSAQRFQMVIGLMDTQTAANQVDGIYFLYDEGGVSTGSTAAAYWQTVTTSNSTRSFNTGITQTTVTAGTWYDLRIEVSGTSNAYFYVNDTLVATHTANIPSGTARVFGAGFMQIKSVGTTASTSTFDYYRIYQNYGAKR